MKLMIASDIHGSAMYCKNLMEAFDREKAERLLLLGDIFISRTEKRFAGRVCTEKGDSYA